MNAHFDLEQRFLDVDGSSIRFPVGRVICIGRNYADHAREMGRDPNVEPPFFFFKSPQSLCRRATSIDYPPLTQNLSHEIEFVVALGKGGAELSAQQARDCIYGFGVGLDLTRRDLQQAAKEMSRPWDEAKNFDDSAAISRLFAVERTPLPESGVLTLSVSDGFIAETRQEGDIADMIWPVGELLSHLSKSVGLRPGDVVMTGTPKGVGVLNVGDTVTMKFADMITQVMNVADRRSSGLR